MPVKLRILLPHFFIWGLLISSGFLIYVNVHSTYKVSEYFVLTAVNIFIFYYTANYFFRKHLRWLSILHIILILLLGIGIKELAIIALKGYLGYDIKHTTSLTHCYVHVVPTALFITTAIIYYFIRYWINLGKKRQNLENEKNLAELKNLKSQINPHFLFNTLNNLYYLCLKKDDIAPEMIMKLSELMRYIVSVGNKDYVELKEELAHIGSYIDLEKMRLPNPSCIVTHFEIEHEAQKIAPLLLLPFIENAFKHSKNRIEEGINITLTEVTHALHFQISNTYNPGHKSKSTGTGLANVRRRLNLIYPGNHRLEITDTNHTFKVDLKISFYADTLHSYR